MKNPLFAIDLIHTKTPTAFLFRRTADGPKSRMYRKLTAASLRRLSIAVDHKARSVHPTRTIVGWNAYL